MRPKNYKRIGILGGMGPQASADLYLAVVGLFQRRYDARYDADFPQIILNSIPAPDVVEHLEDEARLVAVLQQGARTLEQAGADFVAIACNTVHAFHAAIASSVSIPVLDLVEETVAQVHAADHRCVGVLGTGLTIQRGIYRGPCERRDIELLELTDPDQRILTELIMDILAGRPGQDCTERLGVLVGELKDRGAEAVILGCTDLSGVAPAPSPVPVFDTTRILARAVVREAVGD